MLRLIAEVSRKLGLVRPAYRVYELIKAVNPRTATRNMTYLKRTESLEFPLPPTDLMVMVAGTPDVQWFLHFGQAAAQVILAWLADHGFAAEQTRAILEFGCGCGRVLRHLSHLRGPEIHGTDYNPRMIEWCRRHLTFASFEVNHSAPPLPYPEAGFDLVYSISVFTHLSEPLQLAWINELARILRAGGFLIITTMGESFLAKLTAEEKARFRDGQLVVQYDEVSGLNMCAAYHPRAYVQNTLAAGFEVVDCLPAGSRASMFQDLYLLKKR